MREHPGRSCVQMQKESTLVFEQFIVPALSHWERSQACCLHSPDVVSEAVLAALAPPPPPAPVLAVSGAYENFSSLHTMHMPCSPCLHRLSDCPFSAPLVRLKMYCSKKQCALLSRQIQAHFAVLTYLGCFLQYDMLDGTSI